jgi:hypothetical protein
MSNAIPPHQGPHLPQARNTGGRDPDRYAAQNLYAPLRTVEPVAGIGRVNLRRDLALDTLLPTLPVRARALAAWRLEDQWVTAVRLTNTTARWLDLDPRALQGEFRGGDVPAPDLGAGWAVFRHDGGLPRHPRAWPGRVAAAEGSAASTPP